MAIFQDGDSWHSRCNGLFPVTEIDNANLPPSKIINVMVLVLVKDIIDAELCVKHNDEKS
jgi:hypothetical protein